MVAVALAAFLLLSDVTSAAGAGGQLDPTTSHRKLMQAPAPAPVVSDYLTQFCVEQGKRSELVTRTPVISDFPLAAPKMQRCWSRVEKASKSGLAEDPRRDSCIDKLFCLGGRPV